MWTYGFTSTFGRFLVDFGSILEAKSVKKSIEKTIEKTNLEKTTAEGLQNAIWGRRRWSTPSILDVGEGIPLYGG